MSMEHKPAEAGFFDVRAFADALPASSSTLLVDRYMTDRESGSARVFRVYRPTPAHYHRYCDEYLFILSGRGTFWMDDPSTQKLLGPGQLVVFPKGIIHAIPEIVEHPLVFLSIDAPRRQPQDIVFVDPAEGSPETFMDRNAAR